MDLFFFLGWLALAIAVAMFARIRRNRSGVGWFIFSFVFSPLLAFIFLGILRPLAPRTADDDSPTERWLRDHPEYRSQFK